MGELVGEQYYKLNHSICSCLEIWSVIEVLVCNECCHPSLDGSADSYC